MSVEVLEDIQKILKELRLLYRQLVEKLISTYQSTPEERKALRKLAKLDQEQLREA